jgi:hypothetical protein
MVAAVAAVAPACAREPKPARESTTATASSAPAAATPGSDRVACAKTGHWIACQVRERLVRSGLAPHDTSRDKLPVLGPAPAVYRIGKGELAVYLFADSNARARAATQLDTVKYIAAAQPLTILSQTTVIENDNLLALLFSKNDQQRERVSDALTAGPPQP